MNRRLHQLNQPFLGLLGGFGGLNLNRGGRRRSLLALLALALTACAVPEGGDRAASNPSTPANPDAIAANQTSNGSSTINDLLGQGGGQLVADANAPLRLRKPIDCQIDGNCFVLLYPDRDPAKPSAIDYTCGQLTYDDHNGTDFAIPTWTPDTAVPVLASAPGTVTARRDGVPDRRIRTPEDQASVKDIECGNGVMVDHGNGWSTQYCHLKRESVRVQPGDRVETGTPLGEVGLSGMTTFPHVHITVRRGSDAIDPFTGPAQSTGCNLAARSPLWSEPIPYRETGIVRSGFAPQAVTEDDSWLGRWTSDELAGDSPALIFWVHSYGLRTGDVEQFTLIAPDGRKLVDHTQPIDGDTKNRVVYVGQGTRYGPLQKGQWWASFRLVRKGQVIAQSDHVGTVR
ncbi:MAG: M23 family metallopeptidase [Cyanophyceae cyanobacterium]